jgi:glycosyltransferase involved in cell wall biosynthesis
LVPPDDDEALAAAVTRLLDDRALARDMGRRGRERAVERYDIRRSVDELLAVLDGVRRRRTS